MNVDSSASSGITNTNDSSLKATNPSTSQTSTASSIPAPTPEAQAPNAPSISVSAPEGGQEPRFDQVFKAAHTAYRKSRPHPENNLIKIYGLGSLEASVARVDPKTGEKINKLRKSYEGQIKSFGLAGRNKATSHNSDTDGLNLLQLAQWPEEEFAIQRVSGKEVGRGLSDTTRAKLEKAVDLKPGKVPRNAEWENVLGHDKKATTEDVKTRKLEAHREEAQYSTASVKVQVNGHRVNGPTSAPEANRPRRMGKKRSYVDSSFEGYGEGFDDDVHDDDSSNEGSRRSSNSRKKRRKSSNHGPSSFQGTYGAMSPPNPLSRGISSFVSR